MALNKWEQIPEGSNVEIICFFENGIGNVNYLSWRKISPLRTLTFMRQPASTKLLIQKATVLDSGVYQCCIEKDNRPLQCKSASVNIVASKIWELDNLYSMGNHCCQKNVAHASPMNTVIRSRIIAFAMSAISLGSMGSVKGGTAYISRIFATIPR